MATVGGEAAGTGEEAAALATRPARSKASAVRIAHQFVRFVGVGTIRIESSDRSHPELLLVGIEKVDEVAKLIDDCRRKERLRRERHDQS